MCGIAGVMAPPGASADLSGFVEKASALLRHRGPDGRGYWTAPAAGPALLFGHRRLAIIDTSDNASQPMTAHGLTGLLNGEIYNYIELRRELEAAGYQFQTKSDTEVLLACYDRWGSNCLLRLSGMFAVAIADLRRRELFLARDPFGIKPLYYVSTPSVFAFASEPAPLLDFTPCRRANQRRLAQYLEIGTVDAGPETFFEGIAQLPAAHFLRISLPGWPNPQPKPERYWRLSAAPVRKLSLDDAAEQFRELFVNSVRLHLRSDVPVAVAASGGIDSSSILAAVREILGRDAAITAFCYDAGEGSISEKRWARIAVDAARADVHFFQIRSEEVAQDFRRLVAAQGEPFVNPVAYAQFRLFRECASAGIKVLLEGQGADELLGGYSYFLPSRVASALRRGRLVSALGLAGRSPVRVFGRAIATLRTSSDPGGTPFRLALRHAVETSTLPSYLRWGDRNAMAWSVENRVPFLNVALAEFIYSLPEEFLLSDSRTTKLVLRRAMQRSVPQPILNRRDKVGFETPYVSWLEGMRPEVERVLATSYDGPGAAVAGRMASEAQPFLRGSSLSPHLAHRLWAVLILLLWMEAFDVSAELRGAPPDGSGRRNGALRQRVRSVDADGPA